MRTGAHCRKRAAASSLAARQIRQSSPAGSVRNSGRQNARRRGGVRKSHLILSALSRLFEKFHFSSRNYSHIRIFCYGGKIKRIFRRRLDPEDRRRKKRWRDRTAGREGGIKSQDDSVRKEGEGAPKHPTPLLDELESGPWPSFVSGLKRLRDNADARNMRR